VAVAVPYRRGSRCLNDRRPSSSTAKPLEDVGATPAILENADKRPRPLVRERIFSVADIADRAALVSRTVEEHPNLDATMHMTVLIVMPGSVHCREGMLGQALANIHQTEPQLFCVVCGL
jgi:hypothetical protein